MMELPKNRFKAGLKAGATQIGLWNSVNSLVLPDALGPIGYDWIVIDTEHSPVEPTKVMGALQALEAYPQTSAVVRPVVNDTALIKQYLDMGAQTLILPYVQNSDEARSAVDAMRYPPRGVRGVAGGTRASRYGAIEGYATKAEAELCLIVQVETVSAMEQLEDIASVDGVDGVFIGPADLSASMGYPGQPGHPDVKAEIENTFARLQRIGVPGGILTLDPEFAQRCIDLGAAFVAVGVDLSLLTAAARDLRAKF
jgi:4-hydroxy-2-oxoheptanedioate aldolase